MQSDDHDENQVHLGVNKANCLNTSLTFLVIEY